MAEMKNEKIFNTLENEAKKNSTMDSTSSAALAWASRLPPTSRASATVILAGYVLQLISPVLKKYLALVPAR